MLPKIKTHGADMLWKVGTYEEIEGEKNENKGDTGRKIETYIFTYIHTNMIKHASHTTGFYAQIFYLTNTFTHNPFYAQTLLHAKTFIHKQVYTHLQTHLHANVFTHNFFTHKHLYTQPFYTQTLLHTVVFAHKRFKRRRFYTHTKITHKHLYTQTLYQDQPNSKKPTGLDTQTSFCAKGLPPDQPSLQETSV